VPDDEPADEADLSLYGTVKTTLSDLVAMYGAR
jgi:hypothetical protein